MSLTLKTAKRIVIKIGSSLLVDAPSGAIKNRWLEALASDISNIRSNGSDVIVVSSGSIAVGKSHLGLNLSKPLKLEEKQAAAATGQIKLAHAYQESLAKYDITVAQILLTLSDTEERHRHLNARNTILQLLKLNAVPVINENDTIATQEIKYGDNDRLAARVATMISADLLILLSDIDGLYSGDPRKDKNAKHISEVRSVNADIMAMAGDAPVGISTGGMITKLEAAKIALSGGCSMIIAKGEEIHAIKNLMDGAKSTCFRPFDKPKLARKRWIAGSLNICGNVMIDAGAKSALSKGKSLLAAGVVKINGNFNRGDAVIICDIDGNKLGIGLIAFDATDAEYILGKKSSEIRGILGFDCKSEMVHRDDMALDCE